MAGDNSPNDTDRGKGKAKDTDDNTSAAQTTPTTPTTPTTATNGSSVFSRIAQSAAGLGRDFVSARPSGGDLAAIAHTEKAGPAARRGPSSQHSAAAGEGSSASLPTRTLPSTGSSHAEQHATAQDAAFAEFLDGADIDMSLPTEPIIGLDDTRVDSAAPGIIPGMELAWSTHQVFAAEIQHNSNPHQPTSAVAEQESRDGLDVVNLLAVDGPPEEEPVYGDIELAEDEITALRRALFGSESDDGSSPSLSTAADQNWDNVLNFIPDFVRPNRLGGYEDGDGQSSSPIHMERGAAGIKSHETQAVMGMKHSAESTRQWLDQWHDVLTRYDDQVWGGLSPLVAQAREEVGQLKQSEPDQAPAAAKALDRLRQILGHLRD